MRLILLMFVLFNTLNAQSEFWDKIYLKRGISDEATISTTWDKASVEWHYDFIERGIEKHLSGLSVLDVGSGAGHWIEFYQRRGFIVSANDISRIACDSLRQRFPGTEVIQGNILTVALNLNYSGRLFGIINGIAVFHHITDDEEWKESIRACLLLLKPGGLLFISSQFVDSAAADYKKYRSLNRWLSSSVEVVDLIKSKEPPGIKNHDDLLILRKNEL